MRESPIAKATSSGSSKAPVEPSLSRAHQFERVARELRWHGGRVTALVAPNVVAHAAARWHRVRPKRVDWLLSDANWAPQVVLRALSHWCKWLRPQLHGVVFTMKLNDGREADALPQLIARVGEFGLGEPRAVQLPSHRQQVVVIAARKQH